MEGHTKFAPEFLYSKRSEVFTCTTADADLEEIAAEYRDRWLRGVPVERSDDQILNSSQYSHDFVLVHD